MAIWTEIPIEERHFYGEVDVLKDMLQFLGVPLRKLRYRATGREEWDPVRVYLEIEEEPRAGINLHFQTLRCVETTPMVHQGVQKVTLAAIKQIGYLYRPYLEFSPFRLLPRCVPTDHSTMQAIQDIESAPDRERDPCLRVTSRHLLEQDRYLLSVENNYQQLKWHYNNTVKLSNKQQARVEHLVEQLSVEKENTWRERYQRITAQARMEHTQSKFKELEDRNLDLKRKLDDLTTKSQPLFDENRRLTKRVAFLERNNEYNTTNLTNLLRMAIYLQEKEDCLLDTGDDEPDNVVMRDDWYEN